MVETLSDPSSQDTSFVRPEEGHYTDCNHDRFLRERQDATVFHDHVREEQVDSWQCEGISHLNASLFSRGEISHFLGRGV